MKISEICIKRPVFATVLSLVVMLIGIVSYTRLPVREYPKIDEPVVTVDTTYRGASAEIIESQVTKPLEDSLAGIEGVEVITSISRAENSQISVRFKLERAPDSAAADVRDRVSRVRNKLPDSVDEPVIAKVEADANPIIWIAFSSDKHSALEVTDFASRIVKPRLQTLPGAADVRIFGDRKFAMRIWLDRAPPGGLPADPGRCRGCAAEAERRGAGRAHREPRARVLGGRQYRPDDAGRLRRHRRQDGRTATRCASPISGASRSAPPRSAVRCASTAVRRWRSASSSRRRPIRWNCRRPCAPNCPRLPANCRPACAPTSPTIRRSSSTARSRRCSRPSARRSCWCWRSSSSSCATSGRR